MSTVEAQCLIAHLIAFDREATLPSHWRHSSAGDLSWRFGLDADSFTWDPRAVAEAAARWRELDQPPPDAVAPAVAAHTRLLDVLRRAGRTEPDTVLHDLSLGEVTCVWNDQKRVVILDGVSGPGPAPCLPG